MKKLLVFTFLFILINFPLKSAAKDFQPLPDGISVHQLDNGIQVLLIENPALPMIGINTVVKVGSAYENFSTSGMSHMLEHLLFNGTLKMTQKELYDAVDKIGGYNNANTSEYYTNFMMVTPSENFKKGLEIQADMLFNSTLPAKKFNKEKGIVLEEIAKSLARSQEQEERNITGIIYKGHALSLPTLGTYETIKGMNRDDVYKFYKNYYVPNNMIMSVIGSFKTSEMLKLLNEIIGKQKPGNVVQPDNKGWSLAFDKIPAGEGLNSRLYHRFYSGDKTKLQIFYIIDGHSTDFYTLLGISLNKAKDNLQNLLNAKFSDQVKAVNFNIRSYPVRSYLEITAVVNNQKNIFEISDELKIELAKLDMSLSDNEITAESIKNKTKFLRNIEKPHMFGIYNAGLIAEYGLETILDAFGGEGYFAAGNELRTFVIKGEPLLIIQHPSAKSYSDTSNSMLKVKLFDNGKSKPIIIAKQNSASQLLAIHYMIKNKSDYELKYGQNAASIWHDAFGQRMNSIANKTGSIKFGFNFTVNDNPYIPMDNIYLNPAFGYIRAEGLSDNIEEAIKYLNTQMLNFIPTKEEFNIAVKNIGMAHMMMGKDKSKELFDKTYQALIYKPFDEKNDLKKLSYQGLLNFGKEYFNPANIIISVVSKAEPSVVNNFFSKFYKNDTVTSISGLAKQRSFRTITEASNIEQNGGGEQSHLFYGFVKSFDSKDRAALKALSLLLSDEIVFDIREKQGMAYRMSAGINMLKDKALFFIRMSTLPKNVDILVPQFPDFFTPEFADKITEDNLIKSVNMYLGRMMFRRLSSINQAYYLAHSYYFNGDINADSEFLENLKNVSLEEVKHAAEKYLRVENSIQVIIR